MVEIFRRRVIKLLVERGLLNEDFAGNLLSWKHSGFSIDKSVPILDEASQESLAQYIARPPISLKKIRYEPFKGRVLFHTTYSDYFKQNLHMLDALDFFAELTQHIPPKRLQLIRCYGLYASRTKGRWHEMSWVVERAPVGCKATHPTTSTSEDLDYEPLSESEEEVDVDAGKRAWARLLAKVYEINPFVCPKCGAEMKVIEVIEDPNEIRRILQHLVKIGRSPPGFDADRAAWTGSTSCRGASSSGGCGRVGPSGACRRTVRSTKYVSPRSSPGEDCHPAVSCSICPVRRLPYLQE